MPGIFDSKNFNSEVFGAYVDKTPNLNRNELIKSKAIKPRQDIAGSFKEQVGGNYMVTPIYGRIDGSALNYDGKTDITATSSKTYTQGRIVVGRSKAWVENDFSYDITGGVDFLAQAASQVGEYWDEVDQSTILSTLKGIFAMTGAENLKFVNGHTLDISGKTDGVFGATTLNTAMQKALGDNKAKFSLAIMHSAVATNLENLQLLEYMKYTDKDGVQRIWHLQRLTAVLCLLMTECLLRKFRLQVRGRQRSKRIQSIQLMYLEKVQLSIRTAVQKCRMKPTEIHRSTAVRILYTAGSARYFHLTEYHGLTVQSFLRQIHSLKQVLSGLLRIPMKAQRYISLTRLYLSQELLPEVS